MRHVLAAAAALAIAACSPGSPPPPPPIACDASHPCPAGLYCQGVCVAPEALLCVPDVPVCPDGYVCGASSTCVVPPPPLGVAITSPVAPVFARGTVGVHVAVTNGTAATVYLRLDGAWLGAVTGGSYDWNTAGASEGLHALVAVATRGSEAFESAPLAVVVDRTGPRIASSTPADGAGDALPGPVELVLSEPIRPETLEGAVLVSGAGGTIPSTATLRPDGVGVEVSFTPPAARPTTVTIALAPSLADLAGNAAVSSSVSFTYPAWFPLGADVYAGPTGGIADLAVDGLGRPVVLIEDTGGAKPAVRASRYEGGAWHPLGEQVNAAGTDGGGGAVAIDPAGRPVVAYVESRYWLRVKRWDGDAWAAVGNALTPGTSSVGGTSLAFAADGEPVVAYSAYDASPTVPRIFAQRWDAAGAVWVPLGGALDPALTVPSSAPSLAVDPEGRPVVAYEQWGSGGSPFEVHVRRFESGAWTALGGNLAPDPGTNALYPDLALDATGAPLVALGNGSNGQVLRWDGAVWSARGGPFAPLAGYGAPTPALAVDGAGRLLVAFDVNDGYVNRFYVSALEGSAWLEIAPTPSTPGWSAWSIDLELDPSGLAVVALCEQRTISPGPPSVSELRCAVRRQIP